MKIGKKGLCVDQQGKVRWSWHYDAASPEPDFIPPVRLDIDAEGKITEQILFDPTDTMISLDNADFTDGDYALFSDQQGDVRVFRVGETIVFKQLIVVHNPQTGLSETELIDHPVMAIRAARARARARLVQQVLAKGTTP